MKLSEKPISFDQPESIPPSREIPFPTQKKGLTMQEMAAHISALRRPYPHMSFNPLGGNSLY